MSSLRRSRRRGTFAFASVDAATHELAAERGLVAAMRLGIPVRAQSPAVVAALAQSALHLFEVIMQAPPPAAAPGRAGRLGGDAGPIPAALVDGLGAIAGVMAWPTLRGASRRPADRVFDLEDGGPRASQATNPACRGRPSSRAAGPRLHVLNAPPDRVAGLGARARTAGPRQRKIARRRAPRLGQAASFSSIERAWRSPRRRLRLTLCASLPAGSLREVDPRRELTPELLGGRSRGQGPVLVTIEYRSSRRAPRILGGMAESSAAAAPRGAALGLYAMRRTRAA